MSNYFVQPIDYLNRDRH